MKLEEAKREYYRRRAHEEGYKSRAAYKLLEANQRYRLVRPGEVVLDLGSAPGGWTQVAAQAVGGTGLVIGVDLAPVKLRDQGNVRLIQGDINDPSVVPRIRGLIDRSGALPVDVLLSDLSPNISGAWDLDHYKQIELTLRSLAIGDALLRIGGNAMLKVFDGERLAEIKTEAGKRFQTVRIIKPKASRRESSELYLLCLSRRRP